jgi:hypothetical protein
MSIPDPTEEQAMNSTITTLYRVIATTTIGFVDPKVDTTVKWEGSDTDELSREFPPSDIMFADPFDQKEIEDGFIITRFTFERKLADGSWENIDDPRRRLTPITAYERAIDEENRRLFPGDYITECQDCGCDDCQCEDNSYRCNNCGDYGCAKCDPNWCTSCDNHGCASCDPTGICKDCSQYMADVDTLDKDGRCNNCAYYASLRYCDDCVGELNDDNEGNLCANCEFYRTHPVCFDNCSEYADGDDGLCSGCREYYVDLDKRLTSRWYRVLRVCKFWR